MAEMTNEEIINEFNTFDEDKFSLTISSVSTEGIPLTSYAPYVKKDGNYYVSISSSLPHYINMTSTNKAHIFIIEDEKDASHIFARKRLYFNASCKQATNEEEILDLFDVRYGESLSFLRSMKDFKIVEFIPKDKSLVLGFGAAYKMDTDGKLVQKSISHK